MRGTGLGYEMYRYLIEEENFSLISDWSQTKAARGVWMKLAREGYAREWSRAHGMGPKVTDAAPFYESPEKLLIATAQ